MPVQHSESEKYLPEASPNQQQTTLQNLACVFGGGQYMAAPGPAVTRDNPHPSCGRACRPSCRGLPAMRQLLRKPFARLPHFAALPPVRRRASPHQCVRHFGEAQTLQKYLQITFRRQDRKSTRLNSSHRCISYAVFCLKKKKKKTDSKTI